MPAKEHPRCPSINDWSHSEDALAADDQQRKAFRAVASTGKLDLDGPGMDRVKRSLAIASGKD